MFPAWGMPLVLLAALPGIAVAVVAALLLVLSLVVLVVLVVPVYRVVRLLGGTGGRGREPGGQATSAPRWGETPGAFPGESSAGAASPSGDPTSPGSKRVEVRVLEP